MCVFSLFRHRVEGDNTLIVGATNSTCKAINRGKQSIRKATLLDFCAAIIGTMDIPGYKILRRIGQGGMASAHLALQTSLNREVVLKVLDTSSADSPQALERFLNEGRIVASLQHPHIITTYDIGKAGEDVYISMEFVGGGDLKQRLQCPVSSPFEAIDLVRKIASGLGAAHAKGIVHRDVKPANILFRTDGTPLLSDFGIAKRLTGDADLTTTGMFVGSPNYMAPEQSDVGAIDGRADIYALGVIFYEMLTGKKPYYSKSVIDIILMHKKEPVPGLPTGLQAYQELLNLMMAKDRNSRFRDAESLLHYIDMLEQREKLRISDDTSQAVDFDPSARPDEFRNTQATRLEMPTAVPRKMPWLLGGTAIFCAVAYGALIAVEYRMSRDTVTRSVPSIAEVAVLQEGEFDALTAANDREGNEKITDALRWLANHSLNEYRLSAPNQDNAYYYYSRLLQMNPNDEAARNGLLQISERYAILAERDIAEGSYETARSYISIGLQVNPGSETLLVLRDFTEAGKSGLLASILQFFK